MMILVPVLDGDVIAYKVPKGTVGQHTHRGPLGMDFRVGSYLGTGLLIGEYCCHKSKTKEHSVLI